MWESTQEAGGWGWVWGADGDEGREGKCERGKGEGVAIREWWLTRGIQLVSGQRGGLDEDRTRDRSGKSRQRDGGKDIKRHRLIEGRGEGRR